MKRDIPATIPSRASTSTSIVRKYPRRWERKHFFSTAIHMSNALIFLMDFSCGSLKIKNMIIEKGGATMKPTLVVATEGSEYFASLIVAAFPSAKIMPIERSRFGGGERYLRFQIEERMQLFGSDIIIVASIANDDDLNEV